MPKGGKKKWSDSVGMVVVGFCRNTPLYSEGGSTGKGGCPAAYDNHRPHAGAPQAALKRMLPRWTVGEQPKSRNTLYVLGSQVCATTYYFPSL